MNAPRACVYCLRRSWLLGALAPYIEKIATGSGERRTPLLLALSNEELAEVAAPKKADEILGEIGRLNEAELCRAVEAAGCWACCRHDEAFPLGLADGDDCPRALIGLGDPARLGFLAPGGSVTIVGAEAPREVPSTHSA